MTTADLILKLTRQLYPTGRVWYLPDGGFFEALHRGLGQSEAIAFDDAVSILDSLLPDTDRFTADDATDWERRLAIPTTVGNTLTDRKAAILQKLQNPGRNPAKGHYLYIQQQLQLAGFNVFVWENLNPIYGGGFNYFNPAIINPSIFSPVQHGDHQHGDVQHGGYINNVIINSIYNSVDIGFAISNDPSSTFFIGGSPFGTYANVPIAREQEFRQLILSLKPVQNIAYLFINYI